MRWSSIIEVCSFTGKASPAAMNRPDMRHSERLVEVVANLVGNRTDPDGRLIQALPCSALLRALRWRCSLKLPHPSGERYRDG